MVEINFVDGDSRHFELTNNLDNVYFDETGQSYTFKTADGILIVPREFVKSILIIGE